MSHSFSFKNIPHFFHPILFGKLTNKPTNQTIKASSDQAEPTHPFFGSRPRRWRPRHPVVTEPPRPTLTPVRPTKNTHQKLGANKTILRQKCVGMSFVLNFLKVGGGQFVFVWFGEVVLIICFWWTCIVMVVEESCLATWQRKNAYPLKQINTKSK